MVVDPAGVTFDYIEPPSSSSTAAVALQALPSSIHEAESGAGGGKESVRYGNSDAPDRRHQQQQQRYQYSLDFPFYLRKKVKALKFVWESLMPDHDGGADGGGGANTSRQVVARQQSGAEWAAERRNTRPADSDLYREVAARRRYPLVSAQQPDRPGGGDRERRS